LQKGKSKQQNMEQKKLKRSCDKMIAGVCSGVAEYFGIDKSIVRIIWAFLAIFYGAGLLAYIIAWIIMPE